MFEVNLVGLFWDVQKSLCAVMIDFVQQMEIFSQHTATGYFNESMLNNK